MRFLLDANLPRSAAEVVRAAGHDPADVRDVLPPGAPDANVAEHALHQERVLVTRDFDFADVRNYPPEGASGRIVLDLPDHATAKDVRNLLASFLARPDFEAVIRGRLAVVRVGRVRFRPRVST